MATRISFTRSGGFGGMTLRWEADLDRLDPEEGKHLESLIDSSHLFDVPAVRRTRGTLVDQFEYVIDVERDGRRHRVSLHDATVPEPLQPLIASLTKLAKESRRQDTTPERQGS
jgi:hypothetical protein